MLSEAAVAARFNTRVLTVKKSTPSISGSESKPFAAPQAAKPETLSAPVDAKKVLQDITSEFDGDL
jgi:hypothetical protein